MKFTTTLALLVLVGAGFTLYWFTPTAQRDTPPSPAAQILAEITPEAITAVRIRRGSDIIAELKRRPAGTWVVDGNWPANPTEVRPLLDALADLHSRFRAESGDEERALAPATLTVEVQSMTGKHTLTFFERSEDDYRYLAPTYVYVDDQKQPIRVTPGLMAILNRSAERYRQLQLFPSERFARISAPQERTDRLDAKELVLQSTNETPIKLVRATEGWELREPVRDRLDPEAAERVLSAVAELSVRQFIPVEAPAVGITLGTPENPWQAASKLAVLNPAVLEHRAGLDKPQRSLTVTRNDGSVTKLLLGKPVSDDLPPPTPPRGPRPDTFRFAKLEGSALVFDLADTRLNDIFSPLAQLRDARLARFNPDDVEQLSIRHGKESATLVREGKDTWKMRSPRDFAADNARVKDLLTKLSSAEAPERDRDLFGPAHVASAAAASAGAPGSGTLPAVLLALCEAPPAKPALGKLTGTIEVKLREKARPDDRDRARERTLVLHLSQPAGAAGRLNLQAEGWPRVDRIDDGLSTLVDRPGFAYRSKEPLEFKGEDVQRIEIRHLNLAVMGSAPLELLAGSTLAAGVRGQPQAPLILQRAGDGWTLAALGSADAAKAGALADALSKLRAVDYVADQVPPAKMQASYGLGKPTLRVQVAFTDPAKATRELAIGRQRNRDGNYFARLDNSADIFTIGPDLVEQLSRPALAYLPTTLWQIAVDDDIVAFRITKAGQEPYRLTRQAEGWQVSGPFTVTAPTEVVDRLSGELMSPRAVEYRASEVPDPAAFGLDRPTVKVSVTTKTGKEHLLWVGGPTTAASKPGRFARLGTHGGVFVIGEALARAADQSALDFLDRGVLRFDAQTVIRLTRQRGDEVLELQRADDGWLVKKPSEQPGDERKIPSLLDLLSSLNAERIAAFKPKDFATFGLDKPEAALTIRRGDEKSSELVLLIGKEASPGARFVMVQGKPTIGVLSAATTSRLLANALAFRSHDIARVPDADTMKLQTGERKIIFARPEGTWKVSQPISADADHDALEGFFNFLSRLRADALVTDKPTPAQLATFGLDKPAAHWTLLNADEKKLDLIVGKEDAQARRYARLAGKDLIFLLDAKLSAQAVAEYRPRAVWKENIDPAQVESVQFGFAKDPFELKRLDGNWQVVGKPEVRLDPKTVSDTLSALRELKLQRYVVDTGAQLKLYGLDPAELKLEVTTPEGKVRLDLGGRFAETKQRYARVPVPGKSEVFLLDEATSVKLFRDLMGLQKAAK